MYKIFINERHVGETALETMDEARSRSGLAVLNSEYEAFKEVVQKHSLVTCSPTPFIDSEFATAVSTYRELDISLEDSSGSRSQFFDVVVTDLGKLGLSRVIVTAYFARGK